MTLTRCLFGAALLIAPLAAHAQTDSAQTDPPSATTPAAPPIPLRPGDSGGDTGVVHPPVGVDPGMVKTPPTTGRTALPTPVVPPPGSPGGNPNVMPK